jgi:hypothetical protein
MFYGEGLANGRAEAQRGEDTDLSLMPEAPMDTRSSGSRLAPFVARASCSLAMAIAAGCAGSGPPLVEHPRPVAGFDVVSPEADPLAGALRFEAGGTTDGARATIGSALTLAPPPAVAPPPARVTLEEDAWSLALGPDETSTTVAPPIAFDAALWMSAGPAPRLSHVDHGAALVVVSEVAVEEGAWEEERRHHSAP